MHTANGDFLDESVEKFVGRMMPLLNERDRRLFLASFSDFLGRGSAKELSALTGVSEQTISAGRKQLDDLTVDPRARPSSEDDGRVRAEGGGRKSILEENPEAKDVLLGLLDGNTLGDPQSLLTWTTKSSRKLSDEMIGLGHQMSHMTVTRVLRAEGFSLQQNKKYVESGNPGPNRDGQFRHLKAKATAFADAGQPVISVDTKEKELIGNYKNDGREYSPSKEPRLVNDHDFMGPDGKAVPYGTYDVNANEEFVSVGISNDTAEFAVNSIRSWWEQMGSKRYPDARDVMITADCGGSNRLWRLKLQELADEKGLTFHVCHYPPGTSKWNKIEHRMFSFISMNWTGRPLTSLEVIINSIGATTNSSGLRIECSLDGRMYEKGIRVSEEEIGTLNISFDEWMPEWNYTIRPRIV